ncbi:butyrophilin-like protein 1 [Marmota monax]|uniref:butyrophilin-like protein 1 n=1 Tax=Marmota monax TaxID=9995 RepID=UPI001EAFC428|nr:butyrophilin-like protein 1 [Marmota monax]
MVSFPGLSPAGSLLSLLLLVSIQCSTVSGFSVNGPAEPIMALLGEDVTLPCQLYPEQSAARMHIWWYRAQISPAVLVVQNGQEQSGEQMLEYRGRTKLVGDSISKGHVALLIQHVKASDNGQYRCRFQDGDISQEAIIELNVIGLGSIPHVHMTGPKEGGIQVLCSSGGWFPSPKVQWKDMAGAKLPSLSESQTQDWDGLFHVKSSLVVTDSSLSNVTCSIQNPLSGQEKVSSIFLPEPFFPRMSPWKAALAGTVPVLVLLLIGISYIGWKEHQAKDREIKEKENESQKIQQIRNEKEEALKIREKLKAELERRRALYHEDWKKALIYPDWRKEYFQPAPVNLNHELFHQNNSDPKRKKDGREETQDLPLADNKGDCNLLTLDGKGFTTGRYYWEVDVQDNDEWVLGVYETNEEKMAPLKKPSMKKFRVLEKKKGEFRALACDSQKVLLEKPLTEECPKKIVVFLDYEDNDISFYNMIDGMHIFSFTQDKFSAILYPYFKLKSMELSPSA